ncbi:NIPSNAP family protein [Dyella sp.]|uniref:NIPSNAP family protein n=1 Tax=Dyella sp. TaxID=1869338 RepID=UPI0028486036|nr:NIPSNAP family protein [Dyella sp.]MDR3446680.1 NIPSNAP family protein [Dyella sp.]
MRTFELRVYTLRTEAALDFYTGTVFPRHLHNFSLFGVEAHGLWTAKADVAPRAFVLVSYAEGDDPGEVAQRYIQSPEAAHDTRDFDVTDIVSVESTVLVPSASVQVFPSQ